MKRYGLIGYPLGHSFSKRYFTSKFEKEGLADCTFDLFPLKDISGFPGLIKSGQGLLQGLAVTIPYKQLVIPYLSSTDPLSKNIGAVNCIKINNENLIGYNTDSIGFEKSFLPLLKPHQRRALVLGTGGASKAVQYILQKNQLPYLLVSRHPSPENGIISYSALNEKIMLDHTVIINCTPVGMVPQENTFPDIPYPYITTKHLLYDLIYKPETTLFLQKGAARGATIKNGYEMLIIQAEENWRIWNS